MITYQIFLPAVALALWSAVMWGWMYATRIPAILKSRMRLDPNAPRGEQMSMLPASVRWKADNYNNLLEQPTLFYAVAIILGICSAGVGLNLALAWTYVGMRVVHSLIQVLYNNITHRFAVFFLSGLVLLWLSINALMAVLEKTA